MARRSSRRSRSAESARERALFLCRGRVDSKRAACLRSRKVAFSIEIAGSTSPLQKDVSSRNGYAGGSGEGSTFPDDVIARLKPKQVSKKLRCSGDRTRMSEQRAALGAPRATIPGTFQYNNLSLRRRQRSELSVTSTAANVASRNDGSKPSRSTMASANPRVATTSRAATATGEPSPTRTARASGCGC